MIDNIIQALLDNPREAAQYIIAFSLLHFFEGVFIIILHALHDSNARKIDRLRKEITILQERIAAYHPFSS